MDLIQRYSGTFEGLSEDVRDLIAKAYSDNTRRAYQADIASFVAWGGTLPSHPEELARYVSDKSRDLSVHTVKRHLSALSHLHQAMGCTPNPVRNPLVTTTLRGATRHYGAAQRVAAPLMISELRAIIDQLEESAINDRDAALLLVGFAGGFRRSELVSLDFGDIEDLPEGLRITIRKSKTDQEAQGRRIGIPYGRGPYCPVKAFRAWSFRVLNREGPVFRPCTKGGAINDGRLSGEAVARIVKRRVAQIGLNPDRYSGHSLRSGFVTSAIQAGAAEHRVRSQTGHASINSMTRYIREANLFRDNPVSLLF